MIAIRSLFDPDPRCGCEPHGVAAAPIVMAEVMRKSRRFIVVPRMPSKAASNRIQTRDARLDRVSRESTAAPYARVALCEASADVASTVRAGVAGRATRR